METLSHSRATTPAFRGFGNYTAGLTLVRSREDRLAPSGAPRRARNAAAGLVLPDRGATPEP